MASLPARLAPALVFFGILGWTLIPIELPSEARDWTTLRSRCFMHSKLMILIMMSIIEGESFNLHGCCWCT